MKSTTTFNNEGKAMTETCEGIEMPADYSFATVNDYVHTVGRQYEELEALCLGMACEIDRLGKVAIDLAFPPDDLPWYCVSKDGAATRCASRQDALNNVKESEQFWPSGSPYRAVKLMDVVEAEPTI